MLRLKRRQTERLAEISVEGDFEMSIMKKRKAFSSELEL